MCHASCAVAFETTNVLAVAERVNARLARSEWDTSTVDAELETARVPHLTALASTPEAAARKALAARAALTRASSQENF